MPMQTRIRPTILALALTTLAAADAAAQAGRTLAQRLDSIAGAAVLENRAVGTAQLGMTRTMYRVPRRANGYSVRDGVIRRAAATCTSRAARRTRC